MLKEFLEEIKYKTQNINNSISEISNEKERKLYEVKRKFKFSKQNK